MHADELPEFIERYRCGNVSADATAVAGLVKLPANGADGLLFSTSSWCLRWTFVPSSLIADLTPQRTVACGDHEHFLVVLHLRDAGRPESAALLGVIGELTQTVARLSVRPTGASSPMAEDDCYTMIKDGQVWVCCGPEPTCTGVAVTLPE